MQQHAKKNQAVSWTVALFVLLLAIASCQVLSSSIYSIDKNMVRTANSLISGNEPLAILIGTLTSKAGLIAILVAGCAFVGLHTAAGNSHTERMERMSFWCWTGLLLNFGCAILGLTQDLFPVLSPLQLLTHFTNVQSSYDIALPMDVSAIASIPAFSFVFLSMITSKRYPTASKLVMVAGTVVLALRLVVGLEWPSSIVLGAMPAALLLASIAELPAMLSVQSAIKQGLVWTTARELRTENVIVEPALQPSLAQLNAANDLSKDSYTDRGLAA